MRSHRIAACAALALATGCYHGLDGAKADGDASADGGDAADDAAESGTDDGPDMDPLVSECRRPSWEVFLALEASCAGCHGEGTSVPLMQDFVAFEQLVVYDPTLVEFGDPDGSRLLAMLSGEGPPPLSQMPPGTKSFADLESDGLTGIGMAELREWITELESCDRPGGGGSPRFARRVSVEQIRSMLFAQLGITLADVEHATYFPLDDPTFPTLGSGHNSSEVAEARWRALGGPDLLRGDVRNADWSPLFLQTIGPMAQVWCRRAVAMESPALFRHASASSDSATDRAAIEDNIAYLHLHMLGVVASDEDVLAMMTDVYLPYESSAGSSTAWTAVCATFVRDPMWLSL